MAPTSDAVDRYLRTDATGQSQAAESWRLTSLPFLPDGCREGHREDTPPAFNTVGPDVPAMGLDDVLSDGQAQTSAAAAAGPVRFVEAFKDTRQIVGTDSHAGIFDR